MAVGGNPILTRGFKCTAAVVKNRFVKISALETVVQTAASTDVSIGVAQDSVAAGEATRGKGVDVIMAGIAVMEAGAAFSIGVEVMSDTSGRAVLAATATNRAVGVAMKAATGAGDKVPVVLALPGRIL
jgi:hypothetical protein